MAKSPKAADKAKPTELVEKKEKTKEEIEKEKKKAQEAILDEEDDFEEFELDETDAFKLDEKFEEQWQELGWEDEDTDDNFQQRLKVSRLLW